MGFSRRKKSNRQINGTTMIVPGIDSVQFGGIKIDNRNITKFRTGVAPTPTDPTIDRENPFIPQPPTPTPSSSIPTTPTPTPTPTVTQTPSITPTVTVTPTPSVTTTVTPSATPANLLLLDNYSGATAGYSTRKLKSSATLSLRVRRSSDNSEQDIGFDGNNLDLTSLTSFIGSDDAFVTRWYDQSGNNYEFAQLSASLQPRIALSGTVDTANGIPSIYFGEATIKYMEVFLADEPHFDFTDTFSLYMALKPANQSGAQVAFGKGTGLFGQNGYYVVFDPSIAIGNCVFNNSDVSPTNFSVITSGNTSLGCYGWNFSSGNGNGSFNGITNNTYTGMISCKLNNSLPIIGVYQTFASATDFDGWFSEMIIFPSDQTSNKSGIETNIMNYFGI